MPKFIGKQVDTNKKSFEEFAMELRERNEKKEGAFDFKTSPEIVES